jgi:hypothetical protein
MTNPNHEILIEVLKGHTYIITDTVNNWLTKPFNLKNGKYSPYHLFNVLGTTIYLTIAERCNCVIKSDTEIVHRSQIKAVRDRMWDAYKAYTGIEAQSAVELVELFLLYAIDEALIQIRYHGSR